MASGQYLNEVTDTKVFILCIFLIAISGVLGFTAFSYRVDLRLRYAAYKYCRGEWGRLIPIKEYLIEKEITEEDLTSLFGKPGHSTDYAEWTTELGLAKNGSERQLYYYNEEETKLLIFCVQDKIVKAVIEPKG